MLRKLHLNQPHTNAFVVQTEEVVQTPQKEDVQAEQSVQDSMEGVEESRQVDVVPDVGDKETARSG